MAKVNRGRFTITANIIMTGALISRTLSFSLIMMVIYIKFGDDILNEDVIKIVDMEKIAGTMPMGTAVKSLIFSLVGVFPLELMTGMLGMWGAIGRKQLMLAISVLLSSFLIVIYSTYIILIAIIYNEKSDLHDTLHQYTTAYYFGGPEYISREYYYGVFRRFLSVLGCKESYPEMFSCWEIYVEQLRGYLQTYLGLIITCIVCQIVNIIAAEYSYRKFEIKEKNGTISTQKRFLLLSIEHGIFRNCLLFVKKSWVRSKIVFLSTVLKIFSFVFGLGILALGLILTNDKVLTDGSLIFIFKKLYFYQYNLYDILIGIAASSVVIGILTTLLSIANMAGTWMESLKLLKTSLILSLSLHVPRIIAIIFFAIMMEKVNDHLRFVLNVQQDGYYYQYQSYYNNPAVAEFTEHWNYMILELNCCGVYTATDRHSDTLFSEAFCCDNAHVSRMDPSYRYSSRYGSTPDFLKYFGDCPHFKTDTCSSKILSKCRMFVGLFIALLLLQMLSEICGSLFLFKEYTLLKLDDNAKENDKSKVSETGRCCPAILRSICSGLAGFVKANWKRSKLFLLHSVALGTFLIMNISLMALAIHIRYDKLFGNIDINYLLARTDVLGISISRALDRFSAIVTALSACSVAVVIFSIITAVHRRKSLLYMNTGLLAALCIGGIVEIGLWATYISNIYPTISDGFYNDIKDYHYSSSSARFPLSLQWNTLFVKGRCCGVGTEVVSSFIPTSWYRTGQRQYGSHIPIQCCKVETEIYPFHSRSALPCTLYLTPGSYHTEGCDLVISSKLNYYSIPFFVFMAISVVAQTICITTMLLDIRRILREEKTDSSHVQVTDAGKSDVLDVERSKSTKTTKATLGEQNVKKRNQKKRDMKEKSAKATEVKKPSKNPKEGSVTTVTAVDQTHKKQTIDRVEEEIIEKTETKTKEEELVVSEKINENEIDDAIETIQTAEQATTNIDVETETEII